MESEFFGHRKGSFTGANADKEGLFQAADGGTLLLDEVADLPLHMQVKLLRAIQEREVVPVGGTAPVSVNVRIIVATNRDLAKEVQAGMECGIGLQGFNDVKEKDVIECYEEKQVEATLE